jgi:hypothetical protein
MLKYNIQLQHLHIECGRQISFAIALFLVVAEGLKLVHFAARLDTGCKW